MSDSLSDKEQTASTQGVGGIPVGYERLILTRVGNVRELLAGDGGTVADIDPTAEPPLQSSPQ